MLYPFYLQSQKHQHIPIKVTFFVIQKYPAFNECWNNQFFIEESEDSTLNFTVFCIYKDHKFIVILFEIYALYLI